MGYRADYTHLLQNLVRAHPQGAVEFAKKLVSNESGPLIETQAVVDIFLSLNRVQETTAFLLEALKGNKPGEGPLQTKLLEIILLSGNPQFAEAILQNEMFSHYDRPVVAKLCEQAGLFQRALEHYTALADIKRVLGKAPALNPDFLVGFFGKLNKETTVECLNDLLAGNMRQNLQLVVQVRMYVCMRLCLSVCLSACGHVHAACLPADHARTTLLTLSPRSAPLPNTHTHARRWRPSTRTSWAPSRSSSSSRSSSPSRASTTTSRPSSTPPRSPSCTSSTSRRPPSSASSRSVPYPAVTIDRGGDDGGGSTRGHVCMHA